MRCVFEFFVASLSPFMCIDKGIQRLIFFLVWRMKYIDILIFSFNKSYLLSIGINLMRSTEKKSSVNTLKNDDKKKKKRNWLDSKNLLSFIPSINPSVKPTCPEKKENKYNL